MLNKTTLFLIIFLYAGSTYSQVNLTYRQIQAFQQAKTVQIIINDKYYSKENMSLPFYDLTKTILDLTNLKITNKKSDITLNIDVRVEALQTTLSQTYPSLRINGDISMEMPNIPTYQQSFSNIYQPNKNDEPNIFDKSLFDSNSFIISFMRIINKIYGLEPFINILVNVKDNRFKKCAVIILGESKDPMAIKYLIHSFNISDIEIQENAVNALATIGDNAFEPLIEALHDKNIFYREYVALALGSLKDKRAGEHLINALSKNDKFLKRKIILALGLIKDSNALDILIESLKDNDTEIKLNAIFALQEIKSERGIYPLINMLKDNNKNIREKAYEALKKITNKDFDISPQRWLDWFEKK